MRTRSAVATVAALTAGLTATVALRRRAGHLSAPVLAPAARPVNPRTDVHHAAPLRPVAAREGVVLPFVRPAATTATPSASPLPSPSASPARCGDTGGRTKAGAPCAARASAAGRCRHHQLAA